MVANTCMSQPYKKKSHIQGKYLRDQLFENVCLMSVYVSFVLYRLCMV